MKIRTGIEKLGKGMILLIFSIFTIFPFVWMILSALKTKAEIMDVRSFFPAEFQWHNFYQVIFESPLLRYVGNSLFVSVITLALQIVTGAMIAYAIVFMNFKGKKALFAVIMGTYMLPTAATYIPSYIILANWNLLNTFTGLIISNCVSIFGIFLLRQAFMQVPNGTDRGSENRRGKLLEDFVAGRVSDDKIFVHHIWTDELYYLLQQLYVAVSDHRCG